MANRHLRQLTRAQMDALPPGSHVIDGSMDISTKLSNGLWRSRETMDLTTAKLHKYGPIKLWTGVA